MTTSSSSSGKGLYIPALLALLLIFVTGWIVWAAQIRPDVVAAQAAREAHESAGVEAGQPTQQEAITYAMTGDAAHGEELYAGTCSACHGPDGTGIEGLGKDLTASEFVAGKDDGQLVEFIKVGRPTGDPLNTTGIDMPPKGGNPALSDEDLNDIVTYLRTIQTN